MNANQDQTAEAASSRPSRTWAFVFPWLLVLLAALSGFTDAPAIAIALSAGAIVAAIQGRATPSTSPTPTDNPAVD